MSRIEYLNKHFETLIGLNGGGEYQEEVDQTLTEINAELGIGDLAAIKSYSTKELHEELATRAGVEEINIAMEGEAVVESILGDAGKTTSFGGPVRILVNRD